MGSSRVIVLPEEGGAKQQLRLGARAYSILESSWASIVILVTKFRNIWGQ